MPKLYRHWPTVAVALAASVYVQPARACGATPCAQLNDIQPPDGSVGVPLNTEIRVLYFGFLSNEHFDPTCDLDLRPIRLHPDGGEPIYLTGTVLPRPEGQEAQEAWVIARDVEPLTANTTYAVQLLLGPGQDPCRCDGREWTTVSSFTSGEAEDHEPPNFTGLDSLEYGEPVQASSSCGGGSSDVIYVYPELTPVSDAAPAPRYNIYVNGQIAKRYVEEIDPDHYGELFVDCANTSLTTTTRITPGATVEARAVDMAGNESLANTPLTIDVTCDAPPVPPSAPDPSGSGATGNTASAPTDSSAPIVTSAASDSASGCDVSRRSGAASGAAGGAGATALAGVLLLLFRSRVAARRRTIRLPK